MTIANPHPLPSTRKLFGATAVAGAVAAAVLVVAVLPAEHGLDPTGIGRALGLSRLNVSHDDPASAPPPAPAVATSAPSVLPGAAATRSPQNAVTVSDVPYRRDALTLTLQPGEGREIKALMRAGEQFVFRWKAEGGVVNFDMHGERINAGDAFTSHQKGMRQAGGQGVFVAPFDGTHGWFWRNRGKQPVTITVDVAGFYASLK